MANTYQSINLDAASGTTQPAIPIAILVSEWGVVGSDYEIEIAQSTHNRGTSPQVQVFEKVLTDYVEVVVDILVKSNGNIVIKVSQTPDLRFEGRVVISGE